MHFFVPKILYELRDSRIPYIVLRPICALVVRP